MKIQKFISTILLILIIFTAPLYSQDKRNLDTKVADLLALFPASDLYYTDKLMKDMLLLGDEGIRKICDQIIPAGSGDDTNARFAVQSFSGFLSQPGYESERKMWEEICIQYLTIKKDITVRDFFMKQLQLIGSNRALEALSPFYKDKNNCEAAIAVAVSAAGKSAEDILSSLLKDHDIPCPASVLNALAGMQSQNAVDEFIFWSSSTDIGIKAAAYNALAQSGNPEARPLLLKAAKNASFKWDKTASVDALLNYAKRCAEKGDIKTADAINKTLISKCRDKSNMHYKTAALKNYVDLHAYNAMPLLIKAVKNKDAQYRNSALRMSLAFSEEAIKDWISFYPAAPSYAKGDIITLLGLTKNKQASPLIRSAMTDPDIKVRKEAVYALFSIENKNAINDLIQFMLKNPSLEDQAAVKTALMSIAGKEQMSRFKEVLKNGPAPAKQSAIEIMAWGKAKEYFHDVLHYTDSDDQALKNTAFNSLAELAGPNDQDKLIELISSVSDPDHIKAVQAAIISSASQISDPDAGSESILKALSSPENKEKLIPVLSKTGGDDALKMILKEFHEGSPSLSDICFKTLTEWKDLSASSALFEIVSSANKKYEFQAFKGYISQITSARIADEQKLLFYRKILPYAQNGNQINSVLNEIGKLKTYQALFLTAEYFDKAETSASAARAAMNIALPADDSKAGMYGKMVRDILTRAIPLIQGSGSEYEKEMIIKYLASMPSDEGFYPMFNGKDLGGWQGLVGNPITRAKMTSEELAQKQAEADKRLADNWSVKDGCIIFNGRGQNLCSVKEYGDFELLVDWKISKNGDSGIYLRGSPQVQIWDVARVDAGAQVGSGGLYNNIIHESKPLKLADNPVNEWNTFRIIMTGEKVSVWLNGELVVDNVIMENYWDRSIPIFSSGPVELQAHGTDLAFRDIYIREISEKEYNLSPEEKAEGFISLFNGRNLDNWIGNKTSYIVEDNMIVIKPEKGSGGNLFTEKEYDDFIFRFEFQLTPGANNGLGIRAPLKGDAAYLGMEIQILDDTSPVYANLQPYQYHGSVYGVIPARTGFLKPTGEWNYEEVIAIGTHIKVILNGTVIVDGDISGPRDHGTMDKRDHPGLHNKRGHIGFLGHGSVVKFRNIRVKEINE